MSTKNRRVAARRGPARGGPMQVTASSGYAIHGLSYLAWKGDDAVIFLSEIADFFAIPPSYMAKVFQALARAGLVRSYRGARGGYALAKGSHRITLRDVIEVFEGPVTRECPLEQGPCRAEPFCSVYRRLEGARQAWLEALEGYTVGQIGDEYRKFEKIGDWAPIADRNSPA